MMKATWDDQAAALRGALDKLRRLKKVGAAPSTVHGRLLFVEQHYNRRLSGETVQIVTTGQLRRVVAGSRINQAGVGA